VVSAQSKDNEAAVYSSFRPITPIQRVQTMRGLPITSVSGSLSGTVLEPIGANAAA